MNMVLAILAGGGIGSVTRHFALTAWGTPYGTLAVNVIGSFVIGALMELMAFKWDAPPELRAFLVTGFLGGFTTFSAFSFDVLKLVDTGKALEAVLYVMLSVGLSLAAVFGAVYLVRGMVSHG